MSRQNNILGPPKHPSGDHRSQRVATKSIPLSSPTLRQEGLPAEAWRLESFDIVKRDIKETKDDRYQKAF